MKLHQLKFKTWKMCAFIDAMQPKLQIYGFVLIKLKSNFFLHSSIHSFSRSFVRYFFHFICRFTISIELNCYACYWSFYAINARALIIKAQNGCKDSSNEYQNRKYHTEMDFQSNLNLFFMHTKMNRIQIHWH